MKIAITHPTDWPHVRRGTERFMNELARFLHGRGHEITVISAHGGRKVDHTEYGYRTLQYSRTWWPWMGTFGIIEAHAFLWTCYRALLSADFDVVFCCSFTDAYAASVVEQKTGVPYVYWVNGLPPKVKYYRSVSLGGRVFRAAIRNAFEVISLSEFVQDYVRERYDRESVVLGVPVDMDAFPLNTERDLVNPEVVCTASLTDARKGGPVLFRGFDRLKERVPTARLRIAYSVPDRLRDELIQLVSPKWRDDVLFAGTGQLGDLASVYGRAAASVLCSMWEPFGLVVVESLATGTPVAGTRSGALARLLDDPRVGTLFDPGDDALVAPTNAEALAEAMEATIQLSHDPATAQRCRDHAAQYSWDRLGPEFESICERAASGRSVSRA